MQTPPAPSTLPQPAYYSEGEYPTSSCEETSFTRLSVWPKHPFHGYGKLPPNFLAITRPHAYSTRQARIFIVVSSLHTRLPTLPLVFLSNTSASCCDTPHTHLRLWPIARPRKHVDTWSLYNRAVSSHSLSSKTEPLVALPLPLSSLALRSTVRARWYTTTLLSRCFPLQLMASCSLSRRIFTCFCQL